MSTHTSTQSQAEDPGPSRRPEPTSTTDHASTPADERRSKDKPSIRSHPLVRALLDFGPHLSPSLARLRQTTAETAREGLIRLVAHLARAGVVERRVLRIMRRATDPRLYVRDVMMPRVALAGVKRTATVADALDIAGKTGQRWVVVHDGWVDQAVGVVDAIALLGKRPGDRVIWHTTTPALVPNVLSLFRALEQIEASPLPCALVIDEYGGVDGLVEQEALLEGLIAHRSNVRFRRKALVQGEEEKACADSPQAASNTSSVTPISERRRALAR